MAVRAISVGEVMVELAREADGRFAFGCGGDTFNTAVYLARLGVSTAYATALGEDPYSDAILKRADDEGVATDLVLRVPGRMPGLYIIETDKGGERTFYYWRDAAPARELFELAGWERMAESMVGAELLYFSGITLSLYSNAGLGRLLATLEFARGRGAKVAFDSNYRPRGWKSDDVRARTIYAEALRRVDIALPTFEDEARLWGDANPGATIERLRTFGITEVAVKNGQNEVHLDDNGHRAQVAVPKVVKPVDTTAAGDAFNAAYLAARLSGAHAEDAARSAHLLAAQVIQHRGAIIPKATEPAKKPGKKKRRR
jgi:2-dehydro-3-deoxygluconokinase